MSSILGAVGQVVDWQLDIMTVTGVMANMYFLLLAACYRHWRIYFVGTHCEPHTESPANFESVTPADDESHCASFMGLPDAHTSPIDDPI